MFNMQEAKVLLEGQFHEDDEDDIELTKAMLNNN